MLIDFAVAFLIAYLANPLLNWLERGRVKRGLGVFFVVLAFMALLGLAGVLLATVSAQLITLLQKLPDQIGTLGDTLDRLTSWLSGLGIPGLGDTRAQLIEAAQKYVQNLGENLMPILQRGLSSTGSILSGLLSIGGSWGSCC
ncbi:AI-2E family transporter [Deinococcus caeni]|uniref:AI-2E family transporter n=1 Tax=Deinococcus caeni TaxID=569127 RepID=UPI00360E1470